MVPDINIGKWFGVNIFDFTQAFNGKAFHRYIKRALSYVPGEHLQQIESINIYDDCPSHFPVIAQGSHYPSTSKGARIDLYLNQCFGHMVSFHKKRNSITDFFDRIFAHTFGKLFLIHTLYHEIGHHVFHVTSACESKGVNDTEEKYAEEYADNIYGNAYPMAQRYYDVLNRIYHLIYRHRIAKDNEIRSKKGLV
jgi:hypothetical protein